MNTKQTLLQLAVAITICFAVHILVALFSSIIVNSYIINTRLANFTIYDSYADFDILLFYILLSALLVFDRIKGNGFVIALVSFFLILIAKVFVIDVISHYFRFYVNTQQNGSYNLEIFKDQLVSQWDSLFFEFSNLGQLLSFIIWVFIALLVVCYLSLWAKNNINRIEKRFLKKI